LTRNGIIQPRKYKVSGRFCQNCSYVETHETGSQIWVSCRLQDNGWKSINSMCNLPDSEFLRLTKKETIQ
jgi:hypothetical protein